MVLLVFSVLLFPCPYASDCRTLGQMPVECGRHKHLYLPLGEDIDCTFVNTYCCSGVGREGEGRGDTSSTGHRYNLEKKGQVQRKRTVLCHASCVTLVTTTRVDFFFHSLVPHQPHPQLAVSLSFPGV
jgi:hypothetical protein